MPDFLDNLLGKLGSEKRKINYERKQMSERHLTAMMCMGYAREDLHEIKEFLRSTDSSSYFGIGCRIQTLQIHLSVFEYFREDCKKYSKALDRDPFLKGSVLQMDADINIFENEMRDVFRKSERVRLFLTEEERRLYSV